MINIVTKSRKVQKFQCEEIEKDGRWVGCRQATL